MNLSDAFRSSVNSLFAVSRGTFPLTVDPVTHHADGFNLSNMINKNLSRPHQLAHFPNAHYMVTLKGIVALRCHLLHVHMFT